jgi:molybdenum cofactor biosynthesis protein B
MSKKETGKKEKGSKKEKKAVKALKPKPFAVRAAVLTVSDSRDQHNDTSGDYLAEQLELAGHKVVAREIVKEDLYQLRSVVSQWIADDTIQVVLTTGGTGFSAHDNTPEALRPLFDKPIEGFGEIFRHLSYQEIGTSTVQSRAIAGIANKTVILCMPGSTGACKTAWEGIIRQQLDSSQSPCNFVGSLKLGG